MIVDVHFSHVICWSSVSGYMNTGLNLFMGTVSVLLRLAVSTFISCLSKMGLNCFLNWYMSVWHVRILKSSGNMLQVVREEKRMCLIWNRLTVDHSISFQPTSLLVSRQKTANTVTVQYLMNSYKDICQWVCIFQMSMLVERLLEFIKDIVARIRHWLCEVVPCTMEI